MRHSKTRNRSGQVQDGEQQTDGDATADIARQPQVAKRLDAVDRAQVREHSLAVLTPLYWLVDVTDVPLEEEMTTATAHDVVLDNFKFAPGTVNVAAGSTITWTNRDDVPHNVVAVDRRFTSPVLGAGEQYVHRFDAAGIYAYFCSLHPRMTGRIVVA
jgi:plastocyanin